MRPWRPTCQALVGNYREEHVFSLAPALELYDVYQTKVTTCDKQIQAILTLNAPPLRTTCFPPNDDIARPGVQ
jgi:hypothetical protein